MLALFVLLRSSYERDFGCSTVVASFGHYDVGRLSCVALVIAATAAAAAAAAIVVVVVGCGGGTGV